MPQTVVPAVVYVATAMPEPGSVKHHGRGDLVIGAMRAAGAADAGAARACRTWSTSSRRRACRCAISADVMAELWSKLMVNCAYNAISGLAQATVRRAGRAADDRASCSMRSSREVVAVAAAEGVDLPLAPSLEAMERIAAAMPAQLSSTAQDMARGKPSEIDHLNGFVARRGRELGVATPANQALHALVKLVEAGRTHG